MVLWLFCGLLVKLKKHICFIWFNLFFLSLSFQNQIFLMKRAWSFDFSFGFLCEAKRHSRAAVLFTKKSAKKGMYKEIGSSIQP